MKKIGNTEHSSAWKFKEMPDGSITYPATSGNSFAPSGIYIGVRLRVKYDSQCLKQDKVTFTHRKVMNIYTFYEIN